MRYLLITILSIVILSITNLAFSEEPFDTFDKIKGKENKIEFAKTLSLREIVILGSQGADRYDMENAFYFWMECLAPRWQEDPSTMPETISIIVNEKLNPEWEKSIINLLKNVEGLRAFDETDIILPAFLKYIEDKSKDQKTKIILLDIISSRFDGYKNLFTLPKREYIKTEQNFELTNKQASLAIDSLNKIIQDKTTATNVSNSAKVLYGKIREIYLDKNNALPQEFENRESFKQVKGKTKNVIAADLPAYQHAIETIMPKEVPLDEASIKKAIMKEGEALVRAIRTTERVYWADNNFNTYTDKWEHINKEVGIDFSNNKYFTTPPTLTASGEGESAIFTAAVVGSGEAEGVSVSINEKGKITISGLE